MAKQDEFSGLPRHIRARARRRLRYLRQWWRADKANGYHNRLATAAQVVAEIKAAEPGAEISESSLYRWELLLREQGMAGLVDRPKGRPGKYKTEAAMNRDRP